MCIRDRDNTVTIRHRNDQLQERVSIENLVDELQTKMDGYS